MAEDGRARREFLGLHFDLDDLPGLLRWIEARDAASPFAYLATPNVDHLVRLERGDAVLRAAYAGADRLLCDSRVVARLARACGVDLPVVPGSDLTAALLAHPGGIGSLCLIGGREGDDAALARLRPDLRIVQHRPPMGLRGDPAARAAAAAAARDAAADVILLAVGSPQQEMLADEMRGGGAIGGTALCIGASIDFLTGAQRRAPRLVQRAGLEWGWRLLGSPRRLAKRYLVDGPAIFPMVWRWRRARR